jgi:hypothetical protein
MQPVTEAEAVAGRGLEGDRYFQPVEHGDLTAGITLIESEAIEAAATESGVDIRFENSPQHNHGGGCASMICPVSRGGRLGTTAGRIHEVGA